jgi:hypothetical protein
MARQRITNGLKELAEEAFDCGVQNLIDTAAEHGTGPVHSASLDDVMDHVRYTDAWARIILFFNAETVCEKYIRRTHPSGL